MTTDARNAQMRFELENDVQVVDEQELYHFDEAEVDQLFKDRPWKKE